MGMIAVLRQVTPLELQEVRRNPSGTYERLLGGVFEESAALMERMQEIDEKYRSTGVFERLQKAGGQGLNESDRELLRQRNEEFFAIARQAKNVGEGTDGFTHEELSLEKSWHGLHFLLTGCAEGGPPPLADAILGGEEIPDLNGVMALGPARFLTPKQVRDVAKALSDISAEQLASRFNVKSMQAAQIYAAGAHEDLDYFLDYFEHLKNYYAEAASRGSGMLLYIG